jgi:translation elongation factor EF-G
VTGVYFFNGQYPEGVEEGYAGCVVGVAGLGNQIVKTGTVSTSEDCISFVAASSQTKSILKVSVST